MGSSLSFMRGANNRVEARIVLLGLDAAGKTTMLYTMKLGEVTTTIPTIGMNVETVKQSNMDITSWDVGGRDKIRPLWRHYWQDRNAIVFVVDSNDRERLPEATEELGRLLREDELKSAALLVFANKQDLPNAMSVAEIMDKLGLMAIKDRPWHIQPACFVQKEGVKEGFAWLYSALKGGATATSPSSAVKA